MHRWTRSSSPAPPPSGPRTAGGARGWPWPPGAWTEKRRRSAAGRGDQGSFLPEPVSPLSGAAVVQIRPARVTALWGCTSKGLAPRLLMEPQLSVFLLSSSPPVGRGRWLPGFVSSFFPGKKKGGGRGGSVQIFSLIPKELPPSPIREPRSGNPTGEAIIPGPAERAQGPRRRRVCAARPAARARVTRRRRACRERPGLVCPAPPRRHASPRRTQPVPST